MLLSMTGFSSLTISLPYNKDKEATPSQNKQIQLTMTLKSLNSRFFEANCKLPYALNFLETDLIKLFKSKLHRGSIYFSMHMANPNALNYKIEPSLETVANYVRAIEHIKIAFPVAGTLSISDLISLPNIFENKEEPIDSNIANLIINAANELIETLDKARKQEGAILAQDLLQRISVIKKLMEELEPRAAQVIENRKNQLLQVISANSGANSGNTESCPESQNLIIYNQLDKIDIHEEIVRFKTHLDNLHTLIENINIIEKGKKIDFILQELFREINTITSKCSDALISKIAIDIKVELEKAREQAQNIV